MGVLEQVDRRESRTDAEYVDITAAVARTAGADFSIEQMSLRPPRADEVLVRMVATGMCHTDLSARAAELPTPLPVVLGHEGAGVVERVGSAVNNIAPGDHVILGYLSCGTCPECEDGEPASCRNFGPLCFGGCRPDGSHAICGPSEAIVNDRFFGQSSFATYAVAHERNLIKVPTSVPIELLGPLGCGIMTGAGAVWNALDLRPGMSMVVFGVGAVGLSAVMAARVAGASQIICVDPVASRLDMALSLGATHVIDASAEDPTARIREISGDGVDRAFDTTGRGDVIETAGASLRQRGVLALVAISESGGPHFLNLPDLIMGCKTVKGVVEGGGSARRMIPRLIDLYLAGQFPFDRLVRFYDLADINQAATDSLNGSVIKPIIRF